MAVLGASFLAACGDVSDTGNDLVSGEPDEDNIYLGDDTDQEDRFATTTLALTSVGTGFYYPIDVTIAGDENWLYCGAAQYFSGLRHLGADIMAPVDTPVYVVGDGTVVAISGPAASSGWGTGNYGVAVLHESTAGYFIAIYGHIRNLTVSNGSSVTAGQQLGTIGPYTYGSHLHFGVRPGSTVPATNWGRISDPSCSNPGNTNGFVAPITYVTTNAPVGGDDHGNTIATATQVNQGTTYSGSIETGGDVDVFKFTISGSGSVTGSTAGSTDTYCYLLNSGGSTLASDDDSGAGYNCQVTKTGLSAGTYYLKVRHYNSGTGTGAYQVQVTFSSTSGGSGSCHSGSNGGWSYCSTSCPCNAGEGDCDSNAECAAGLTCASNVGASYGWASSMDVCQGPSGSAGGSSCQGACGGAAASGGCYCDSVCAQYGDCCADYSQYCGGGSSPGGSSGFASIGVGSSVGGYVAQGAQDTYSFAMTSGQHYTVTMTPTSADADLYTSNSSAISTSNWQCRPYLGGTSAETCAFTAPWSGTNYILVHGYNASGYSLTVTSP